MLTSCQTEDSLTGNSRTENPIVTEAREFFENAITDGITRRTLDQERGWNPGEVTPQWEQTAFKNDERYQYVFVPILTQYNYMARETAVRDSIERTYHVRVSQVLCIRKNAEGKQSAAYLTLIPSKGYYSTNKNSVVEKYIKNESFHGTFTGRVLYNDILTFQLLAIDKVIDGEYEWGFSLGSVPSQHSFWRNYRKMFKNISVFAFAQTRWDDDYEIDPIEAIYCARCHCRNCICGNDSGNDDYGSDNTNNDSDNSSSNNNDYDWGNPTNPTYPTYPGGGGGSSGGSSSGSNNENDEQKKQEDKYKQLGEEAFSKIQSDLESGNVQVVPWRLSPNGEALIDAGSYVANTKGILTSCMDFMKNAGPLASTFGKTVSGLGLVTGSYQTYVAFSDGDITTKDALTAISTALNAIGLVAAFIPGGQIVAGVAGVASCAIGIVTFFMSENMPQNIHIRLKDGTNINLQFISLS